MAAFSLKTFRLFGLAFPFYTGMFCFSRLFAKKELEPAADIAASSFLAHLKKNFRLETAADIAPFFQFSSALLMIAYFWSSSNALIKLKYELLCVAETCNLIFLIIIDAQMCWSKICFELQKNEIWYFLISLDGCANVLIKVSDKMFLSASNLKLNC